MRIEYEKGDIIITKDKQHVLKICDVRDSKHISSCSVCFFFKLKGLCTFNREKYLGDKVKGLSCKGSATMHCLLELNSYYFKEIKGGI